MWVMQTKILFFIISSFHTQKAFHYNVLQNIRLSKKIFKMGNSSSLKIEVERDPPLYKPGEEVKGILHVFLSSSSVRYIDLQFIGKAKTAWSEGGGKHKSHYGQKYVYFDKKITLFDEGEEWMGPKSFPFTLRLKQDIPSSLNFPCGQITYKLLAKAETSFFTYKNSLELSVESCLQSNPAFYLSPKSVKGTEPLACFCLGNGEFDYSFETNKAVFTPGENILFSLRIDNNSPFPPLVVEVALNQVVECIGQLKGERCQNCQCITEEKEYRYFKPLGRWSATGKRIAEGQGTIRGMLRLPEDCVASGIGKLCPLIDVKYQITVKMIFDTCTGTFRDEIELFVVPRNTNWTEVESYHNDAVMETRNNAPETTGYGWINHIETQQSGSNWVKPSLDLKIPQGPTMPNTQVNEEVQSQNPNIDLSDFVWASLPYKQGKE